MDITDLEVVLEHLCTRCKFVLPECNGDPTFANELYPNLPEPQSDAVLKCTGFKSKEED